MDPAARRRVSPWTLLIACGGAVLLALALAVAVGTPANLGLTVARDAALQPQVTWVAPDSAAWIAGVRPGASVIRQTPSGSPAPEQVVVRAAGRLVALDARALTPTAGDWSAAGLGLCLLVFGALVWLKSPHHVAAGAYWRMSLLASLALGLVPAGVHGVPWALALDSVALKLFGPALLELVLIILATPAAAAASAIRRRPPWARLLLWLPAVLLVALSPLVWWRPGVFFSPLTIAGACVLAGYLLAACARVITVLRRPRDAPLAAQLRLFALGLLGGLTPFVALSLLPLVLIGRVLVSADLTILALALLPLSVGVAILRSELLGVVSLVHRPTLHSVLRITLLATIMGISGGAVAVAQQYQAWLAPVIAAGVSACLALCFSPVLGWLTRRGERIFLRDTYDTGGILLQISAELAQATPPEAGPLVVTRLTSVLDLSFAALLTDAQEWTCCHPRSAIPDALRSAARQRARAILTQASGAAAVVERVRRVPVLFLPVGQDTDVRAVLCLGPKRSGDRYTSQDRALLGVLGRHLAILFSNHRLHGRLAAHITALHAAAEDRLVLSDQVRVAAQHERRRLAGALHDEAIQLGEEVIRVLGDLLTAPRLPLETQARLTTAALLSDDLVGRLREVVTELYPPPLETAGLLPALHALLRDTERRGGYTCALVSDPLITRGRFPQEMEETLYTITREAVGNAVRHAKATSITVALACVGDHLRLTVCDNGQGFTPRAVSDLLASGHLGLALLQERVRALEGTVTLTTAAGQGTTVEVRVPAPVVRPAVEVSV